MGDVLSFCCHASIINFVLRLALGSWSGSHQLSRVMDEAVTVDVPGFRKPALCTGYPVAVVLPQDPMAAWESKASALLLFACDFAWWSVACVRVCGFAFVSTFLA